MVGWGVRSILVLGAAGALTLAWPQSLRAQDDVVGLPIGSAAPAAAVQDLDGRSVDLAQVVGKKPVLLEFWATWCPLCAGLMPKIQTAQSRHGDAVEFIEVAVGVNETLASVRRHVDAQHYPFRFVWDATGAAVRAYLAPTTSYVVVVNAAGRVVYTGTGADQDIEAAIRRATGN